MHAPSQTPYITTLESHAGSLAQPMWHPSGLLQFQVIPAYSPGGCQAVQQMQPFCGLGTPAPGRCGENPPGQAVQQSLLQLHAHARVMAGEKLQTAAQLDGSCCSSSCSLPQQAAESSPLQQLQPVSHQLHAVRVPKLASQQSPGLQICSTMGAGTQSTAANTSRSVSRAGSPDSRDNACSSPAMSGLWSASSHSSTHHAPRVLSALNSSDLAYLADGRSSIAAGGQSSTAAFESNQPLGALVPVPALQNVMSLTGESNDEQCNIELCSSWDGSCSTDSLYQDDVWETEA